jgi:cytochrome c5
MAEPDPAKVYQKNCEQFHSRGLGETPAAGNAEAWRPRIAQGTDTLVDHAVNGFDQMPAKAETKP